MMAVSLTYTPVFGAGLEKLERFVTLTGIVIVSPFFVLGTPRAMKRFLIAFGAAAFTICSFSLSSLGGSERLATPSDNTIGLGHLACGLILLFWFGVLPRHAVPTEIFVYFCCSRSSSVFDRFGITRLGNRVRGCHFIKPLLYSSVFWIWLLSRLLGTRRDPLPPYSRIIF